MSTHDIIGFEWDEANRQKSLLKHTIMWFESEQVFFNNPLLIDPDIDHSSSEQRFRALGRTNAGKPLFISFTIRRGFIRIISARPMSRLERKIYEENI
ncbi:BrnT family toxin [Candidatus Uhrbacteria bacterium]|nr:BrnT family toxin [Candidatus Uhrbacteria bacterium]